MFNPFDTTRREATDLSPRISNLPNIQPPTSPAPSSYVSGDAFNLPEIAPPQSSQDTAPLPTSSQDTTPGDAFNLPEIQPLIDPLSLEGVRRSLGVQPTSSAPQAPIQTPSPLSYQGIRNTLASDTGSSTYIPSPFDYINTKKRLSVPGIPTTSHYEAPKYSGGIGPYNQEAAQNRESYDEMLKDGLIPPNTSFRTKPFLILPCMIPKNTIYCSR